CFFFQAEDGIRDGHVTGVQTCALPISLDQVGGLDEAFFHFCEDMDLCLRLRKAGYGIRFVPGARAVHAGGASAPRSTTLPILAEIGRASCRERVCRWVGGVVVWRRGVW